MPTIANEKTTLSSHLWILHNWATVKTTPRTIIRSPDFVQTRTPQSSRARYNITHYIVLQQTSIYAQWFASSTGYITERPFHYLGELELFFFSRLFFSVHVKAGFFFTYHLKPDFFFTKHWRSDFFLIVMLGRQLFLPLCQSDNYFFFLQLSKPTYTGWVKVFFWPMQRQIIFSKTLPAPPPR